MVLIALKELVRIIFITEPANIVLMNVIILILNFLMIQKNIVMINVLINILII